MNAVEAPQYVVEIVEDATGNVEHRSNPTSLRRAERIQDGMSINLNHARVLGPASSPRRRRRKA